MSKAAVIIRKDVFIAILFFIHSVFAAKPIFITLRKLLTYCQPPTRTLLELVTQSDVRFTHILQRCNIYLSHGSFASRVIKIAINTVHIFSRLRLCTFIHFHNAPLKSTLYYADSAKSNQTSIILILPKSRSPVIIMEIRYSKSRDVDSCYGKIDRHFGFFSRCV